jgi:hypothetical protein
LIKDQGESAFIIEFNSVLDSATISSYAPIPSTTDSCISQDDMISSLYSTASNLSNSSSIPHQPLPQTSVLVGGIITWRGVVGKKKYKPVAQKVKPVIAELPRKYRIVREIIGDPLADMLCLDLNPPPFQPTGRYTEEHRAKIDQNHQSFLWPKE